MMIYRHSGFGLPSSFDIRASSFVFWTECLCPLGESVCANCEQEYPTHERIALKESSIDPGEIEFLRLVLIKQRCRNQRHR